MFDLHVHSAPCVLPRLAGDVQTVAWYEEGGFEGCVLKGHYEPTAGRAAAAGTGRRVRVHGGIVLNRPAGGLEPAAVDAALALGARVVWMPTLDALGHLEAGLGRPPAAAPGPALAVPPRDPAAAEPVRRILASVAEADAVIATGHLTGPEVGWLVRAAREAGVRRVLVTHPTFLVPDLGEAELRELAELGAALELCAYQLLHQPGCDAARLAAAVRAAGPEHVVLSSDAGQPDTPPAPEALALLVEALAAEGLDRAALEASASELPRRLVEDY
ncbi:MAG TPA: DUF6282 family protein [Gaiellaceae bacterium]|nr:DUF6282 family protein [Gaiellaceae bacterium]